MAASTILGGFAAASFILLVWQWLAARRFPLHRRISDNSFVPPITVLKPLKGADAAVAECLRSWFTQNYPGAMQLLLGVESESNPACEVVRELIAEFPTRDATLVVCSESRGTNPKVSKLIQMARLAKHQILVVSDADVYAPSDLLLNLVAPMAPRPGRAASARTQVGLVTCLYRLGNPATTAMRLEAVAVNADFWSQVLQARSLGRLDFALGAVMCVRGDALAQIGGFAALADYLADDYQLGNKIARAGWEIALCPVVVECRSAPLDWKSVWQHQVRWARTIRVCKPVPYFFSILSDATVWSLAWFLSSPGLLTGALAGAIMCARLLVARDLVGRLTGVRPPGWLVWAVPIKDIFQLAVWMGAFIGRTVEWRGQRYGLGEDGRLVRFR